MSLLQTPFSGPKNLGFDISWLSPRRRSQGVTMLSMRDQNLTSTATHKVAKSSYLNTTESRPSSSADDHAENNNTRLKSSSHGPSPTVRSWKSDNRPTSTAVTTSKVYSRLLADLVLPLEPLLFCPKTETMKTLSLFPVVAIHFLIYFVQTVQLPQNRKNQLR